MIALPVAVAALGTMAYGMYEPNSGLFGPVIGRGPRSERVAYLTFDDGPNPGTTDRLLGMLDRAHIKAVFFVCGWRLEAEEPLRGRTRALLRDEFVTVCGPPPPWSAR